MIEAAQLHEHEISQMIQKTWYNPEYKYYTPGYREVPRFPPDNAFKRDFACLDSSGNIVGLVCYNINVRGTIADNLTIVCFDKEKSHIFCMDLIKILKDMFEVYGIKYLFFDAVEGNPALPKYRKLVQIVGGREVGTMHNRVMLEDGTYANQVYFEVSKENYDSRKLRILENYENRTMPI